MGQNALWYARPINGFWQIELVEQSDQVGRYASLALDSAERPHLAYHNITSGNLAYAAWTGTYWVVQTVDLAP
ncbi:MAG: hypothetical protein ACK44M_04450 [Chloroflexus sp.]